MVSTWTTARTLDCDRAPSSSSIAFTTSQMTSIAPNPAYTGSRSGSSRAVALVYCADGTYVSLAARWFFVLQEYVRMRERGDMSVGASRGDLFGWFAPTWHCDEVLAFELRWVERRKVHMGAFSLPQERVGCRHDLSAPTRGRFTWLDKSRQISDTHQIRNNSVNAYHFSSSSRRAPCCPHSFYWIHPCSCLRGRCCLVCAIRFQSALRKASWEGSHCNRQRCRSCSWRLDRRRCISQRKRAAELRVKYPYVVMS